MGISLRLLDADLRAQIRGNDPSFDLNKLAFFAEATGAVQESHILEAQNAVANARKTSLQAGVALFKTSLGNDQILHERHLAASKTDEARSRTAALTSLEASLSKRVINDIQVLFWLWIWLPWRHVYSKLIYFNLNLIILNPSFVSPWLPWQKMHHTAWGLVQTFVADTLPTWNASQKKSQGGVVSFWILWRFWYWE